MRLPKIYTALLGLFCIATLTSCSSVSPDFSDMSQTYQKAIEKYQNNNLLLNVVRSSKSMPLSFLDIPNVIGTGSISETAGLSGLFISAQPSSLGGLFSAAGATVGASSLSPSLGLSLGRSFNFTQSSLQNAQFEKEFLSTIPVETIHFFAKNHIPRELVFSLTVAGIEVQTPDGNATVLYNNPTSADFPKFQAYLRRLIDYGLSTEILSVDTPMGPAMDVKKLGPAIAGTILEYVRAKKAEQVDFKPVSDKTPDMYQFSQQSKVARICFLPTKNTKEVIEEFGESMFCQNPLGTKQQKKETLGVTGTLNPNISKTSLAFQIRSNRDIYQYLGQALLAQQQQNPRMTYLQTPTMSQLGQKQPEDLMVPLIVINKNPPFGSKSLAFIEYDGDIYSIPSENNGYSAMVVDVLSQFLNLNKIPGSIPASPAVLVK